MEHAAALADPDAAAPPGPAVPFFTQAAAFTALWPSIAANIETVVDRGKYSHGPLVGRFEQALARYTGARFAIGVNSGTDALVLLMRAAGLEPGDEVVVPAFSFIASASAVVLAGGRPAFADIDPDTYTLDLAAVEVGKRTRMVMPVHLFCQLADLTAVERFAQRHALTVVEDSAEAIGMRWDGAHAGLRGAGGVLSFFPTKTLGAIGDAGAVITDDATVADSVAALRHHGRYGHTLDHFPGINTETAVPGFNSKMDDIQAAVLLAKLERLDADIARRGELAAAYTERLRGCPGVRRLPTVVERDVDTTPVFYVYLVEVDHRDTLAAYLAAHGVGTETYYPVPLHLQPCFAELGHRRGDFPVAEAACARTLALPLYPDLTDFQVDRVCALIRAFFGGGGS
ncbi:DegT/DnrJ/EryC1/StrS family aminotransferase [Actinokineospora auranticolor]|uniref:dTDP-4-amino-4,6-dideoxygalactose transaminase n=1 Tax=Actinokineospora auranticolor TaxID=155976 RepID=A0A2S6GFT9_9PSEU|nr:DegT/DnrJ/EryC1/StrS family aminotransferase [Actinokineospora auranticolor]PPK64070.1 dTDP-4-amino-4,6-dideoxygalactose transaminase [Actinokineospora auranticolor]